MAEENTAHQFSFENAFNDEKINLSEYKDKVVMVVNTASECGFTSQYKNMENLWQQYKDKDFVLIAVPSNDFGKQEPGDIEDICEFVNTQYGVTFPVTEKNVVKGDDAHEFYKWANDEAGMMGSPKWNFHKYIIDKNGKFSEWYSSPTKPDSDKIKKKIDELLAQS
jgi:glutathione peroxidase